MGTQISDIVVVNITRETAKITQAGFGTPLVFGPLTEFADRYRVYGSIEAVEEDFETTTEQWKAAAALFGQEVSPEKIVIGRFDTAETLGDELSAMQEAYGDWYALMLTRDGVEADQIADIAAAAAWIEPRDKIFIGCIAEADMLTSATSDIASTLKAAGYERTAIMYSADHAKYPEGAWLGRCLPEDPGSITWKYKSLSGITPDDLTDTAVDNLGSKNANFYETIAGKNTISGDAVMASGEYIDTIRGCDWLKARIAEGIFLELINADKIPFTVHGFCVIENQIRYRLQKGVDVGFLADGTISITMPDIDSVDPAQKAQRYLSGVEFSAKIAEAIHKLSISGRLTL